MYNIKDAIERLKKIANLDSNIQLASTLNVSYNTLNTWIKRGKLPQEVLIEFTTKYKSSLDYILFNKNYNTKEINKSTDNLFETEIGNSFVYYGTNKELNINIGAILTLDKKTLHSNAYYLLKSDNIYTIKQVEIDIFSKKITLIEPLGTRQYINNQEFELINMGMIIKIKNI